MPLHIRACPGLHEYIKKSPTKPDKQKETRLWHASGYGGGLLHGSATVDFARSRIGVESFCIGFGFGVAGMYRKNHRSIHPPHLFMHASVHTISHSYTLLHAQVHACTHIRTCILHAYLPVCLHACMYTYSHYVDIHTCI